MYIGICYRNPLEILINSLINKTYEDAQQLIIANIK